jgi:hypothetical protein
MPRAKKPRYYRAKTSFPVTEGGILADSVREGEVLSANHPYVERYTDMLEPTEKFGRFDVEQATAAPGEKRGDASEKDEKS